MYQNCSDYFEICCQGLAPGDYTLILTNLYDSQVIEIQLNLAQSDNCNGCAFFKTPDECFPQGNYKGVLMFNGTEIKNLNVSIQ